MTKKIIGYVKEQLKKGYSASAISRSLLKSGYRKGDIDKIFTQVYSPEVRHVIHFSPTTLIAIAGIFTGLASMLFVFLVFFNSSGVPETLLDLNLKSVKTTVNVGDDITFISELDNLGSAKRYDVNLRYELIHSRTSEVVTFKEETRAIETKGSKQLSMEVPSDVSEGNYILRAIATYDGQRAVATLPVKVEEVLGGVEVPDEVVEEEPEEVVEEPEDNTVTSALSTFETLEKVEKIANQDRKGAESLCNALQLQTSRDLCFNKLAEVLGDRTYCGKIAEERTGDICLSNIATVLDRSDFCGDVKKESRRDSCYMNFVTGGKKDFTVCGKVANQYLRQSCESLRQLSKLNITDVAYYEGLINQSLFELV